MASELTKRSKMSSEDFFDHTSGLSKVSLNHKRYIYVHKEQRGPFEAIDVHHVVVRKSRVRDGLVLCTAVLIFLACASYCLIVKEGPGIGLFWSIMLSAFLVKSSYQKGVEKESVIVMPAFGVQLETHYRSGRIVRRFVPIGKILKPVLNECVTPVTCYWCLAFIVRDEADLMLVFQELCPPAKILVPVWRALCTATDGMESADKKATTLD